jgi:hypothetical protein
MALNNDQVKEIEKSMSDFLELRRPPVEIRDQLDLDYRIEGLSVYIFEIRSQYDNPAIKFESPVAKTTFVKSRNLWKIFWMRANLKWDTYRPKPEVKYFHQFLLIVDEDRLGCFWG